MARKLLKGQVSPLIQPIKFVQKIDNALRSTAAIEKLIAVIPCWKVRVRSEHPKIGGYGIARIAELNVLGFSQSIE